MSVQYDTVCYQLSAGLFPVLNRTVRHPSAGVFIVLTGPVKRYAFRLLEVFSHLFFVFPAHVAPI